jgi:hypothetical protein
MGTVTGPDGNQWQTCDGNDAKCIEAMGTKCPNGYVLGGHEKLFNCKPDHADDQDQCVTDKALERISGPSDASAAARPLADYHANGMGEPPAEVKLKCKHVRGPDCHMWLMCPSYMDTGYVGNADCLRSVGRECVHGYIEAELFGEAMYQCKSPPDARQPDAIAPPDVGD